MPHLCTSAFRALAFIGAGLAVAAASGCTQPLPPAEEVVARHMRSIGGMQALAAQQYRHTREEASGPDGRPAMTRDVYRARQGNRYVMKMEAPQTGPVAIGYDGQTAWMMDTVVGPSIQRSQERSAYDFESPINFARLFPTMETVGRDTVNGESCIRVRMVNARGDEVRNCFADDDGLLIGATVRSTTGVHTYVGEVTYHDYRDFGGIKMATRTSTTSMNRRNEVRLVSVSTEPIDASVFALPAEVAALKKN
ncbi:hypothetical protein [Longimicrobium terrae]|uniref:Outer membrane lipoprotein-sorting protein n=1 Tax=Longimicrobium terrae TaxID=1639882 RepID=A0A841GWZ8_9BACT|nr:hypothetical protein [Longimicrobium terrae]MBB6069995.1 hypothetical protein [Longimicrobium terrae]NNC32905.1 hypothetical protein [Longimicrobium terrae]